MQNEVERKLGMHRALLDELPCAVILFNAEGRVDEYNRTAEMYAEKGKEEAMGVKAGELLDRRLHQELLQGI